MKPTIWRLLVPCDLTLAQLHTVLQVAMGWEDYQLHEFEIGGLTIGAPDPDAPRTLINEKKVRLLDVLGKVGAKGVYAYDFGDGWEHNIFVEKILTPEPGVGRTASFREQLRRSANRGQTLLPTCQTGNKEHPYDADQSWPFKTNLPTLQL